jgi:hypothetical protein
MNAGVTLQTEQGNLERAFWFQQFVVRGIDIKLHFERHKSESA